MIDFRSRVWTVLFIVALLGPIAVVLGLMWFAPIRPQNTLAPNAAATAGPSKSLLLAPMSQPAVKPAEAPILVAGDGRSLWLARPLLLGDDNRVFTLLARSSNVREKGKDNWLTARSDRGEYFTGTPRLLTTVPPANNASPRVTSSAYVVFGDGNITSYALANFESHRPVPNANRAEAITGAHDGVFVLGRGSLRPSTKPATRPSTQPHSQAAVTTQAERAHWSLYWFHNGLWDQLAAMGTDGDAGVPAKGASIVLGKLPGTAPNPSRIVAAWVNPDAPRTLIARSLAYGDKSAGWSKPVSTTLPSEAQRLLTTNIDGAVFVFWPVRAEVGQTVSLHGGRLVNAAGADTDLTLPPPRILPPLELGELSKTSDIHRDLGIGATGNSIAVVLKSVQKNKDGEAPQLSTLIFTDKGEAVGGATTIETQGPRPNLILFQNIAMIVLVTLLAMSLWQWRKKPPVFAIPSGMVVSQLSKRFTGFAIDLFFAVGAVAIIFSIYDPADWQRIMQAWVRGFISPDAFLSAPELLYLLGCYVGHVTLGELFLGRSIGKMLTGQRVLMVDGKPPTVLAVLVRNLVRLPELFAGAGILLIYMVISEHRQRLGDLMARTVVVRQRNPDDEKPAEKDEEA